MWKRASVTPSDFAAIALLLASAGVSIQAQQMAPTPSPDAALKESLPDAPSTHALPSSQADTPAQQQSSSSQSEPTQALVPSNPNVFVTVLENTLLRVRTDQPLSSRYSKGGQPVLFTLSEDVIVDNMLVIPRGATIHGEVVGAKKAGTLTGSPDLILRLTSLDLGKQSYPLYAYQFRVEGTSKSKPTETKIKGGAVIGAIVGGVFSGSAKGETTAVGKLAGMGTGAALGAGVGALTSAATPGPTVTLPAESQMDFYLASPISVKPLMEKEAARLSQGFRRGEPVLYVRGDTP
ncbi:hypothetical protein [Acidipila rosea]|nr:hypothetical protein [Acidipila rosea]